MADTTIEWARRPRTDGSLMPGYTFNPWWGCVRVSPACDHCYADSFAHRLGLDLWTANGPRRFFGEKHWQEPERWNAKAAKLGEQHLVFCASMADVGEKRADLDPWREKLWDLIARTPHLVWLLLTKRPQYLRKVVPWRGRWPANVWFGATVESPDYLWRAEELLEADVGVRFISYEPAVGPPAFSDVLGPDRVNWLLIGSESGVQSRPMPLAWAHEAIRQARTMGASPLVKQLDAGLLSLGRKGVAVKDMERLPADLRVRRATFALGNRIAGCPCETHVRADCAWCMGELPEDVCACHGSDGE